MNSAQTPTLGTLEALALSAVSVLGATAMRWVLHPVLPDYATFLFFILAVIVSARWGGIISGVCSMLFGAFLGEYLFLNPPYTFGPEGLQQWVYLLVFLATASASIWVVYALRKAQLVAAEASLLARTHGEELDRGIKHAEEALAENRRELEAERARYRDLFNTVPIPYLITNCEGIIEAANQEAARLLDRSAESLTGFSLAQLLVQEDRDLVLENIGRLTSGKDQSIENWEVMLASETRPPIPCGITVNGLRNENNQIVGLRWLLRDISERRLVHDRIMRLNAELEMRVKERTAELEAANRELEAFSYSVSHDLRAPLRSISGFSRAVLDDYADKLDEQGVAYLRYSHEAALRMSRLIDDLLSFSRFSRQEMRKQEVDLSEMASNIVRDLRRTEPQRQVEISIAPEVKVQGDESLLRIALQNLLNNAWKFTSKGDTAKIELGTFQKDGAEVYFVRDNGAGFNMAHADRLFGVFQRLHTAEEFPGTGIGLATVKRIFHRHGGRIWAEAEENRGATFYFTLPNGS